MREEECDERAHVDTFKRDARRLLARISSTNIACLASALMNLPVKDELRLDKLAEVVLEQARAGSDRQRHVDKFVRLCATLATKISMRSPSYASLLALANANAAVADPEHARELVNFRQAIVARLRRELKADLTRSCIYETYSIGRRLLNKQATTKSKAAESAAAEVDKQVAKKLATAVERMRANLRFAVAMHECDELSQEDMHTLLACVSRLAASQASAECVAVLRKALGQSALDHDDDDKVVDDLDSTMWDSLSETPQQQEQKEPSREDVDVDDDDWLVPLAMSAPAAENMLQKRIEEGLFAIIQKAELLFSNDYAYNMCLIIEVCSCS